MSDPLSVNGAFMGKPDFVQRETELKRLPAGNRSLLILLLAGLVLVAAFAFAPCAISKPGATLIAIAPGHAAELVTAGVPSP